MKLLGLALSLVIGFSSTANASILLEPYLGYGLGNVDVNNGALKGKINAPVLGARVAAEFAVLFVGADYGMSLSPKFEEDSTGQKIDAANSQLYAVVGANLPLIRAWAGYGLMNETTLKDPSGDTKLKDGTNIKLGVGLKLIPMMSINVEYLMNAYKKVNSADIDSKMNTVLLSASVPLSF